MLSRHVNDHGKRIVNERVECLVPAPEGGASPRGKAVPHSGVAHIPVAWEGSDAGPNY